MGFSDIFFSINKRVYGNITTFLDRILQRKFANN